MEVALETVSWVAAYNAVTAFCILAFGALMFREWKRTDRIEDELATERKYRTEVLFPLLNECKDALNQNTKVIAKATETIDRNSRILERILMEKM